MAPSHRSAGQTPSVPTRVYEYKSRNKFATFDFNTARLLYRCPSREAANCQDFRLQIIRESFESSLADPSIFRALTLMHRICSSPERHDKLFPFLDSERPFNRPVSRPHYRWSFPSRRDLPWLSVPNPSGLGWTNAQISCPARLHRIKMH